MRKIPIIIFSLLFGAVSFAQEVELSGTGAYSWQPSFWYLREIIGMFFIFGAEKKAEKALKYAEEKLAKAKAMNQALVCGYCLGFFLQAYPKY